MGTGSKKKHKFKKKHKLILHFLQNCEALGVVHILRNQQRGGGGFQMLTVDYGGGGGGGGWTLIT